MTKVKICSLYVFRIKVVILLFLLLINVYVFAPFINGIGCDFILSNDSESYYQKGYCKNGLLIIETKDKITGEEKIKKMLWGYWRGYNYTWQINSKIVKEGVGSEYSKSVLYSAYKLIVGGYFPSTDQVFWIYDKPFEVIYSTKNEGRLGFFD